ncbi:hypothetical protein FPV67DRAFT_1454462 [Lyophyllum atratum]|nr:hypothetical protein FPV67DRAFT_1454462 [Lyophyllum atratum]
MPVSQRALDLIEKATGPVNEVIDQSPPEGRSLPTTVLWIISLVNAILHSLIHIIEDIDTRLNELEETSSSESEAADETAAAAHAAPAANQAEINRARFLGLPLPQPQPPQPSTERAAPAATQGTRPPRCTQCHARGHTVVDCRTANPFAMHQRLARNSRIAWEARFVWYTPATIPFTPAPAYAYQPPPAPVAPVPMAYAVLAADATELRRC